MHEIRNARDALGRNVEVVDEARLRAWRRRHRDRVGVVDVVGQAHLHAPARCGRERARDQLPSRLLEIEVVERQVEALLGGGDELARVLGDLEGALAAVREGADLERQAYPRALK
jgi:hypothetical protein